MITPLSSLTSYRSDPLSSEPLIKLKNISFHSEMNRDLNNMISIRLREKICFNFLENMNHYYDSDKKLNNIKLRRSAAKVPTPLCLQMVWFGSDTFSGPWILLESTKQTKSFIKTTKDW